MAYKDYSADDLIRQAREKDTEAFGSLLERYKPWLLTRANQKLGPEIKRRVSASDVVQDANTEAVRSISEMSGVTEPEFRAWLAIILDRVIIKSYRRHIGQQKRSLEREQHFDRSKSSSTSSLVTRIAASIPTPSGAAIRQEDLQRVERALAQLPQDQRLAIRLRYLEYRSLAQVAARLDRSNEAVAGLLKRGLKKLKAILGPENA